MKIKIKKSPKGKFIPLTEDLTEVKGPSHEEGGIPFMGVEIEGNEIIYNGQDNSTTIFGNAFLPGTNKKFKKVAKDLAKKDKKVQGYINKGNEILDNLGDRNLLDKWDTMKQNAGIAMLEGGALKAIELKQTKEHLASLQQALLETADDMGADPFQLSKGKVAKAKNGMKVKAVDGKKLNPGDDYMAILKKYADQKGLDFEKLKRLVTQESGFNPKAVSSKGAKGIMQLLPSVAKKYGVTERQLTSSDLKDVEAVINAGTEEFKNLLGKNSNDYMLALAAYNGGQGAVDFVKKQLKKKDITGEEWVDFMEERNKKSPTRKTHAWQNETLDYVKTITGNSDDDFYGGAAEDFRKKYYDKNYEENLKRVNTPYEKPSLKEIITGKNKNTYNPRTVGKEDYSLDVKNPGKKDIPSNAKGLDWYQVAPELVAFAQNKVQPVWMQQFQPQLFQPTQVSFQDRMNENQTSFNALSKIMGNNPEALATLAAQKYSADNAVKGEEFRTNQQIEEDVTNKNIALLNDAQLKNIGLADTQFTRQEQAKSNTRQLNNSILNSITGKIAQNESRNQALKYYESLTGYRFNPESGQMEYMRDNMAEYLPTDNTASGTADNTATKKVLDESGNVKRITYSTPSNIDTAIKIQQLQKGNYKRLQQILGEKGSVVRMFNSYKK